MRRERVKRAKEIYREGENRKRQLSKGEKRERKESDKMARERERERREVQIEKIPATINFAAEKLPLVSK
jgi:hypothetical protein